MVCGARREHFDRDEDSDTETDEGDELDATDDNRELMGDEATGGVGVDEERDPATEGYKEGYATERHMAVEEAPELREAIYERDCAMFGENARGDVWHV